MATINNTTIAPNGVSSFMRDSNSRISQLFEQGRHYGGCLACLTRWSMLNGSRTYELSDSPCFSCLMMRNNASNLSINPEHRQDIDYVFLLNYNSPRSMKELMDEELE